MPRIEMILSGNGARGRHTDGGKAEDRLEQIQGQGPRQRGMSTSCDRNTDKIYFDAVLACSLSFQRPGEKSRVDVS